MASGRNKKKRKNGKAQAQTKPVQAKPQNESASKAQNTPADKKESLEQTFFDQPETAEQPAETQTKEQENKSADKNEAQPESERQAKEKQEDAKSDDNAEPVQTEESEDKAESEVQPEETTAGSETADLAKESEDSAAAEDAAEQSAFTLPEIPSGMTAKKKKRRKKRHYVFLCIVFLTLFIVVGSAVWIYQMFSTSQIDLFNIRQDVELPNMIGLRWNDVKKDVEYRGFALEKEEVFHESAPYGEIVDQNPRAPRNVKEGSRIVVKVSKGVETITVPDITGWHKDTAKEKLRALGLTLMILPVEEDTVPPDCVIRTEPEAGSIVKSNSTIKMYVYRERSGIPYVTVPSCVGAASERDAGMRLTRNGLLMRTAYAEAEVPAGTVIDQSPRAGSMLIRGSVVTVTISSGPPTPPPPPPEPEPEPESEPEPPKPEPKPEPPKPEPPKPDPPKPDPPKPEPPVSEPVQPAMVNDARVYR